MSRFRELDFMGFPDYCVSDGGRVWVWRMGRNKQYRWKRMRGGSLKHNGGYVRVNLTTPDGTPQNFLVHVLVLTCFVGPCPPGKECRHLNGNKTDNRLSNICWGTKKQNGEDRVRHGTTNLGKSINKGVANGQCVLSETQVLSIRKKYVHGVYGYKRLGDEYGVDMTTIRDIIKGVLWAWL